MVGRRSEDSLILYTVSGGHRADWVEQEMDSA
jgi:hypothetical protein